MTLSDIERELTDAAKAALIRRGNAMIGAQTQLVKGSPEWRELAGYGLIGTRGGLSIRGSVLAERLKREDEERLFPL